MGIENSSFKGRSGVKFTRKGIFDSHSSFYNFGRTIRVIRVSPTLTEMLVIKEIETVGQLTNVQLTLLIWLSTESSAALPIGHFPTQ